jgi:cytochrome c553
MTLKLIRIALLAAASLMVATTAATAAAAPAISASARLAATCAACHGTSGDTHGGTLPRLAGQPHQALSASLHAFKTGQRASTIMTQIAKGYSDEQLDLLAAYFAAQKPGAAK